MDRLQRDKDTVVDKPRIERYVQKLDHAGIMLSLRQQQVLTLASELGISPAETKAPAPARPQASSAEAKQAAPSSTTPPPLPTTMRS